MAGKTRGHRLLILALAIALMALPGLVLTTLGLSNLVSVWTMGSTAGFVAMMTGGPRVAATVAVALLVLMPLATWSSGSPWFGAVILAIAAAVAAYPARWYRDTGTNWAVITLVFAAANPPSMGHDLTPSDILLIGVIASLAVLWGMGMAAAGGATGPTTPSGGVGQRHALAFALVKGAAVGATTGVVIDRHLGLAGAWMVMTVVLVVQPGIADTWSRSLQRAAGTVAGFVIALVVGVVVPWSPVVYIAGTLFLVLALVMRKKGITYWRYVALMTPAVVLMEGANGAVVTTDIERLFATVIGAAISLTLVALMWPLRRGATVEPALSSKESTTPVDPRI